MQHRDEEREVRHWSIEDGPQGGRRSPRERNDSGAWPKSGGGRGGSYHRSRQNGVDRGEERRRCGFGVGKTSVEEDARSSDDHFCNRGCVERVGEREGGSIRRRTKRGEGGGPTHDIGVAAVLGRRVTQAGEQRRGSLGRLPRGRT
jgi:hypothetical protein